MTGSFVWPLLAAAFLIAANDRRPFRRPVYGTALFVLGALSGALAVLN